MKAFVYGLYVAALTVLMGCQPLAQQLAGSPQAKVPASLSADAFSGLVMQVEIPSRGADAVLARVAVNKDVETWLTADDISLSFRRGVLVASRGLGFDLMAADAQTTLDAIAGMGPEVYRRQMRFLNGENHSTYLIAGCSMAVLGSEVVDGQRLQRLEERCQTRGNRFTNIFLLNGSGQIVQSRQWVSPQIGYLSSSLRQR